MSQLTRSPRNIPCILLVAALFFSAFFGVFPYPSEASGPPVAEHSHDADVVHNHMEHPDGIFETPQLVAANGQEGGLSLADGYIFGVRSRHGLPLERPPESASHLS